LAKTLASIAASAASIRSSVEDHVTTASGSILAR
jgi:hypothetical protein